MVVVYRQLNGSDILRDATFVVSFAPNPNRPCRKAGGAASSDAHSKWEVLL